LQQLLPERGDVRMSKPVCMRDIGGFAAGLLAASVGLGVLLATLPLSFVDGTSAYWRTPSADGIDAITSLTGLRYLLSLPWTFPLLDLPGIGSSGGISAVYTDSIPLLALALKALHAGDVNPYGWWIAGCYLATPVAAVRVARLLGVCGLTDTMAVATLAVCFPAFGLCLPRTSLEASQAFILVALELYIRRQRRNPWPWGEFVLPVMAIGVHPYILAFCLVPLCAGALQASSSAWSTVPAGAVMVRSFGPLVAGCLCALGFGLALGIRPPPLGGDLEWGHYSMNLMAPFWPRFSSLVPMDVDAIIDPRQTDARAWPGFGIVALVATAACTLHARRAFSNNRWLSLGGLLCLAFAVTTRPAFGPWRLFDYYPAFLSVPLETFRASGRFAWVPAWIVIVGSVSCISRLRHGTWLLLGLSVLQLADTGAVRTEAYRMATSSHPPWLERGPALSAFASADGIEVHVPYDCVSTVQSEQLGLEVVELASETRTPIDSARSARRTTDCRAAALRALDSRSKPGILRLFLALPGDADAQAPSWTEACPSLPARDGLIVKACMPPRQITIP
jgi:hypothetical protein